MPRQTCAPQCAGERPGIPDGQPAICRSVSPLRWSPPMPMILGRLDFDQLAILPRGNEPPDAAFYRANGLEPQMTVRSGDRTFHLSRPVPGARRQRRRSSPSDETSFGTSCRVSSIRSRNEHGVWRSAIARREQQLGVEGRARFRSWRCHLRRYPRHSVGLLDATFANESSVDIAAELRRPLLGRWSTTQGATALPEAVRERAFFSAISRMSSSCAEGANSVPSSALRKRACRSNSGAEDSKDELKPDATWRLAAMAVRSSALWSRHWPTLHGLVNRQAVYVVPCAADGRTWVPSIQMANTVHGRPSARAGAVTRATSPPRR